jgi:hypothetical protein
MVSNQDIELVKLYFEHLIQCVVGCGCWGRGWDDEEDVRKFAREGFVGWVDAPSPAGVLAALVRLDAIDASELARASQVLELCFDDVDALPAFWAPSIAVLRAELG